MARVFVHHDKAGRILSVASVRVMSDTLPHPFQLDAGADAVLEASPDDPAFAGGLAQVHDTHVVDTATGTLIPAAPGEQAAVKTPPAGKPPAVKPRRSKPPAR